MFFSIIIPVYNVERWLSACLDSVLSQEFTDYEIIIVDDCSPDKSYEIYEAYAKQHTCISILKHKINKCIGGARNTGIQNAKGEWIFFLDSDDLMAQGVLGRIADQYTLNKDMYDDIDVIGGAREFFYDKRHLTPLYIQKIYKKSHKTRLNDFPEILQDIHVCNKLWRRSFLQNNDICFRENIFYEDIDFYMVSIAKARYMYVNDFYFIKVRRYREGSITTVLEGHKFYDLLCGYECALEKLKQHDLLIESIHWVIINRLLLCFVKPLVVVGFYLSVNEKQQRYKHYLILKNKAKYYGKQYRVLKKTQSHHKTNFNKALYRFFLIFYTLPHPLFYTVSKMYVAIFRTMLKLTKRQTKK